MSLLLSSSDAGDDSALEYYAKVLGAAGATAIKVQLDVGGKGKGIVAIRDISEGETVFRERPLALLRHLENHDAGHACEHCLKFVGSIEQQIGHKLHCLVKRLRGGQRQGDTGGECAAAPGAGDGGQPGNGDDGNADEDEEVDLDAALEAGERLEQIYSHVSPDRIQGLLSGAESLPLADRFSLPQPMPCRRRCGALYCSSACEGAAWDGWHCLLCTGGASAAGSGEASDPAGPGPSSSRPPPQGAATVPPSPSTSQSLPSPSPSGAAEALPAGAGAGAGPSLGAGGAAGGAGDAGGAGPSSSSSAPASSASSSAAAAAAIAAGGEEELYGITVDRRALAAFAEHARETNEIFLLAAQVVAATWLAAARALAAAAGGAAAAAGGAAAAADALRAAWRPYSYGWKRLWWEAVAVPDDVDDEEEFRGQLRALASDSLELLGAAIRDPRFGPELLRLEVYGSIVGMFELNNLGLSVGTPVEDFFLAVDAMEEGTDREAAMRVTQPLLDALDAEYASGAEATAFMALQSCINHSCDPNCTAAAEGPDATVSVVAQRPIPAGSEITLSYIDVSLPYKARQAELADYGFVCRCERCVADAAAARARRGGAGGKGLRVGGRRR